MFLRYRESPDPQVRSRHSGRGINADRLQHQRPGSAGGSGNRALRLEKSCAGTFSNWTALLTAGTANTMAFFALVHALRVINVNRINVINASQNAMCAVGAVLLFGERLGPPALAGIVA